MRASYGIEIGAESVRAVQLKRRGSLGFVRIGVKYLVLMSQAKSVYWRNQWPSLLQPCRPKGG